MTLNSRSTPSDQRWYARIARLGVGTVMVASMTGCGNSTAGDVTSSTPTEQVAGQVTASAPESPSSPTSAAGSSQPSTSPVAIDPALIELARERGTVSVIVTLAVPYRPEAELTSPTEVAAQRTAISTTQDDLIAAVPNATVTTRMMLFPQIVLNVDEATLHQLAASPLVVAVDANSPSAPTS